MSHAAKAAVSGNSLSTAGEIPVLKGITYRRNHHRQQTGARNTDVSTSVSLEPRLLALAQPSRRADACWKPQASFCGGE